MIQVKRRKMDEDGRLIRPPSNWFARAKSATRRALREGNSHEADDGIYATVEVRAALEKLFHDKCAYCEWQPTGGSDWNVEHFRPAGAVAEREDHPGYYWLAYKWENLYLSCTHCNQARKDKPRWDDPQWLPVGGKADQFPLRDESTRAMSHGDKVDMEEKLLLDPCADDPERYLGYDPHGQVIALSESDGSAKTTIEVFHLTRRRLKDLRKPVILRAVKILRAKRQATTRGDTVGLRLCSDLLAEMGADYSQFAGSVRFGVKNESIFVKASL